MVTFKPTVRIKRLTPALMRILNLLYQEDMKPALGGGFSGKPDDLVVTSINDSQVHAKNSRHYTDEAIDLRSRNFPKGRRRAFRAYLAEQLGPQFTVLLENEGTPNEHFHIQPKKGTTYP